MPRSAIKQFKINMHKLIYFSPYDTCTSVLVHGIWTSVLVHGIWNNQLKNWKTDMQYCVSKGLYDEK